MLSSILKMATEQVLGSRPALEQPITHLKYGLLGSLASGLIIALGVTALTAGLYVWLVAEGLGQAPALFTVGLVLILAALLIWITANNFAERKTQHQQTATEASKANADPLDEVKALALELVRAAAESFVDGYKTSTQTSSETLQEAKVGEGKSHGETKGEPIYHAAERPEAAKEKAH